MIYYLGMITVLTFLIILTVVHKVPSLANYLERANITISLTGKLTFDLIFRDKKEC